MSIKTRKKPRVVVVQTTVPNAVLARRMARALVESSDAACVQYFPIRSVYRWKGRVESAAEHVLWVKTVSSRAAGLMRRIRAMHPYELPECVVMEISGGAPGYLAWVARETSVRPGVK